MTLDSREQGISKSRNRFVRSVAVEIAWMWGALPAAKPADALVQPALCGAGKRGRKVGIVAVARKLLIELWRCRQTGVLPEGTLLKGESAPSQ